MKRKSLISLLTMLVFSGTMFFFTSCGEEDTTAPVITIEGDNPMTINLGEEFVDPGATATDEEDGDVDVTVSGTVDVNNAGEYPINYTATDEEGNSATETRTVYVQITPSNMEGTWKHTDVIGGTSYPPENETITKSSQHGDRIYFSKFAGYTNLQPYATLSGNDGRTLTIPEQTFQNVGNSNDLTVTVKSDAITIDTDAAGFTITYTLDAGSGAENCSSDYEKL